MIGSLGDVLDVLKAATLVKFRLFQSREKPNEAFVREVEADISRLREMMAQEGRRHPYLFSRNSLPSQIVIVTTDAGFLGEINTLLLGIALDQRQSPEDEITVLGSWGARSLEDIGQKHKAFSGISDDVLPLEVERIRDHVLKGYRERFGRIIIVYPRFVSLTVQKVAVWKGLPFVVDTAGQARETARPYKDMLVEPSSVRVLEGLVELWLGFRIAELFWSAKQAEFAARIMHLEGSVQELGQRRRELSLEYFRQVHTLRDKGLREITASRMIAGGK